MTDPIIPELEAVFAFYGSNLVTRDQWAEHGFVDPQTLARRGLLRPTSGNGFARGWTRTVPANHPCKPKYER